MILHSSCGSGLRRGVGCSRRPGTACVEFAVLAPVLVLLLMGMMEVTRAVQVKNYLTDSARSSARIAIQPGNSNQNVKDNITNLLAANGLPSASATVTILVNGNQVDVNTAKKYDQISVKVAMPISQTAWVTLYYFSSASVESETTIMMHL